MGNFSSIWYGFILMKFIPYNSITLRSVNAHYSNKKTIIIYLIQLYAVCLFLKLCWTNRTMTLKQILFYYLKPPLFYIHIIMQIIQIFSFIVTYKLKRRVIEQRSYTLTEHSTHVGININLVWNIFMLFLIWSRSMLIF